MMAGYSPTLDIGIVLGTNAATGMNLTLNASGEFYKNGRFYSETFCEVYATVQRAMGVAKPMNCSAVEPPGGACFCDPATSLYDGKQVVYPIEVGQGQGFSSLKQHHQWRPHPHQHPLLWHGGSAGNSSGGSSSGSRFNDDTLKPLPPMSCDALFKLFEQGGSGCSALKQYFESSNVQDYKVLLESCCLPKKGNSMRMRIQPIRCSLAPRATL
jgi:hypothetical protein